MGYPEHCVHTGPIIRQEQEYRLESIEIRRKLLKKMMAFFRQVNIQCKSIYIEKKHISDEVEVAGKLAKNLSTFLRNHISEFLSYDVVKVYYDNGQIELNKILSSVFKCDNHTLSNSEKRFFESERVLKKNYIKPLKQKMME